MEKKIHETVIITADEGKVFRRIADGTIYGKEIWLGDTYYIGGVKLDEPHHDVPEDFEEIDEPEDMRKMREKMENISTNA